MKIEKVGESPLLKKKRNVMHLTQFDVGSKEFYNCENLQKGQTKDEFFALYSLGHLQIHWFVIYMASLLCCPRIQNPTHHAYFLLNLTAIHQTH